MREYTNVIIKEADRLQRLMDRMLDAARRPRRADGHPRSAGARAHLVEAEFGIDIERDYDPSIPVVGDREQLIQAVLNIARNAAQVAARASPCVRAPCASHHLRQRHRLALELRVIDDGPGVPAEIQERIFNPLVSGRGRRHRLGLRSPRRSSRHQGVIEFESRPGRTIFRILLPLTMKPVWIVDDDRSIRWVLEKASAGRHRLQSVHLARRTRSTRFRRRAGCAGLRHPHAGRSGLELLNAVKRAIRRAGHRHDGALGSGQRGLRLPGRRLRIPAEALRHRPGGRAGPPRARREPARAEAVETAAQTPEILGQAPAMQEVFRAIGRLSRSSVTVLITGESAPARNSSRARCTA